MFNNRILDGLFATYRVAVEESLNRGVEIIPDITDYLNEEIIEIKMKHEVVSQIPGALTGIGILGTFIGLAFGVSGIAFSSVDVAIVSISSVLSGIKIAFYTSICGVSLSVVFSFLYNWFYNRMIDELYEFTERFHREVIPSTEQQMDNSRIRFQQKVLQLIELNKQENK